MDSALPAETVFARDLASAAGALMREHFLTGPAVRSKDDGSPVTVADEAVNDLVLARVAEVFPDDAVLGEEGSSRGSGEPGGPRGPGRVWVCDPIDGTAAFVAGVPTNVFSLALVVDGVPVLGVVLDPYLGRLWTAERGRGAWLDAHRLQVGSGPLVGGIVAVPGARYGLTDNASLAAEVIGSGIVVGSVGSIAYESALVASGAVTAAVFPGETVWDVAAAALLVEEAGGRVTDLRGQPQRYDGPIGGAVLSNGVVHDELVALVGRHLLAAG